MHVTECDCQPILNKNKDLSSPCSTKCRLSLKDAIVPTFTFSQALLSHKSHYSGFAKSFSAVFLQHKHCLTAIQTSTLKGSYCARIVSFQSLGTKQELSSVLPSSPFVEAVEVLLLLVVVHLLPLLVHLKPQQLRLLQRLRADCAVKPEHSRASIS